jgi:hypothetical protein
MCASLTFRETPLLQILIPTLVTFAIREDEKLKNSENPSENFTQSGVWFPFCHKVVDQAVYELQFLDNQVSFHEICFLFWKNGDWFGETLEVFLWNAFLNFTESRDIIFGKYEPDSRIFGHPCSLPF